MSKEAKARIRINKLLEEANWRFFDTPQGKANILLETNIKITEKILDGFGVNFEKTKKGFIDFLLLDESGYPLVVLEAKKEDRDPLVGKEQARKYAHSLNVRFIILSNGNLHYFWDTQFDNPYIITKFSTQESLKHKNDFKPNPKNLLNENIESDYIVISQKPDYKENPDWKNLNTKQDFISKNKLKFLRDYQIRAIESIQNAVKEGKSRFLFEMATGTGKTLVAAAVIKLFLRSGNAKRVLFLVDRLELEDQAKKNFILYLKNDYKTVIFKENKEDWIRAEIVISTVQSLLFNNKYKDLFSPTDFDLVISDEAHRSISGSSRALFEYFTGYKLGLTATPKDYLKKIDRDELIQKDPRQLERRQLLDTYITFGCESAEPTFRYTLLEGVQDGYLVNPIVIDARTEITTQLLSDEGYSVIIEMNAENEEEEEAIFYQKDFEKNFFSEKTNMTFCKTFFENALTDPITGEIGKSIIFCVSQKHASKITQILNDFAHKIFPGMYNSDFAVQVTSFVPDAQQMTINFANNNLNGYTKFLEGYKSSKTRVCVTVGMMTTGYDCEDILNLCLMRPVFSPTYFVQMKGRGTRKFNFTHLEKHKSCRIQKYNQEKTNFKLFDFFAVCEYFEERYNYDEIIKLPPIIGEKHLEGGFISPIPQGDYESFIPDPLHKMKETPIGIEGMKIDRKLFEKFEETVKSDSYILKSIEEGNFKKAEDHILKEVFDRPEDYFNLDKLRQAVNIDRRLSLREILEKIFGKIKKFKTRDELLEEEVDKFISIYHPEHNMIHIIRQFIKAYISDNQLREIIKNKAFPELATNPRFTLKDLKELGEWRDTVVEYINDYIPLNTFVA